ncbi:MAG: hypothetical protein KKC85_20570 [Gammaproteobacteria bacterium]|nr:hypothetical protein [Gammaproteobacteria bacterium]MBU1441181.1 hypothetical protein [Gammaproteobacteria bacterium]MBU2288804.1 hypothetical protein [Gammaproteobacteria bacterium]
MESPAHLTDTSFPMSCMRCNQLLHGVDRFCRHCGQDQLDADFDPWESRPAALGATSRTAPLASFDWTPAPAAAPAFAPARARVQVQELGEPPGRTIAFTRLSIGLMAMAMLALVAALTHDLYRTLQEDEAQPREPGWTLQRINSPAGNTDAPAAQNTLAMASPAAPAKLDVQSMQDPLERPAQEPDDGPDRVPEVKAMPVQMQMQVPMAVAVPMPMPMPAAASLPAGPAAAAFASPSPITVEAPPSVAAPLRADEALTDASRPAPCPDALAALALCPSR